MGSSGDKQGSDDLPKMFVRYKFKNDNKEYEEWLTETHYKNLKSLDLIEYCKIIPAPDKV